MKEPKIVMADTFFKRLFGLMGKSDYEDILGFKNCKAIHTCFMRFKIDVIITDKANKIIDFKKAIKPWRIIVNTKAYYFYEMKTKDKIYKIDDYFPKG